MEESAAPPLSKENGGAAFFGLERPKAARSNRSAEGLDIGIIGNGVADNHD